MQKVHIALFVLQGSPRLEKYLNLEGFLEKSLKIKSALKSAGKSLKNLKSPLILQGSHKLWKSWKTWKITKKVPCMEKSWNLKKTLNNQGKIMEFYEII